MRKRDAQSVETPIASLIDVVFLLIIFFVVTASVEKDVVDESIRLAQADYVKPTEKRDPRTVIVNLHADGSLNVGLRSLSLRQLRQVLKATAAKSGTSVPVVLRCDADTSYRTIKNVLDVIGEVGLYRVRLAAVVTRGE